MSNCPNDVVKKSSQNAPETCWSTLALDHDLGVDAVEFDIDHDFPEDSTDLSLTDGSEDDANDAALFSAELFPASASATPVQGAARPRTNSFEEFSLDNKETAQSCVCPCCHSTLHTDSMLVFHAHVKACFVKKNSYEGTTTPKAPSNDVPISATIDNIRSSVSRMDVRERINFMESLARLATMSARQRFHRRTSNSADTPTVKPAKAPLSLHENSASECEEEPSEELLDELASPGVVPRASSAPSTSSSSSSSSPSSSFSPPKITKTDYRVLSLLCSDVTENQSRERSVVLRSYSAPLPSPLPSTFASTATRQPSPLNKGTRPLGLTLPPSPLFSFSEKSCLGGAPLVQICSFSDQKPLGTFEPCFSEISTPDIGPCDSQMGLAAPTPTNNVKTRGSTSRKRKLAQALSFSPQQARNRRLALANDREQFAY